MGVKLPGFVIEHRENGPVALVWFHTKHEVLDTGITRASIPERILNVLLGKIGTYVWMAVVDDAHGSPRFAQFPVQFQLLAGVDKVALGRGAGMVFWVKFVEFLQDVRERVAGIHLSSNGLGTTQHPTGFIGVIRQPLRKTLLQQVFWNLECNLIRHIFNR